MNKPHGWLVPKTIALVIAAAIWLPCLHFFYAPADIGDYRQRRAIAPKARKIAARHLAIWSDPQRRRVELGKMQKTNPEWDFMSRTFFVLSLANMALHEPAQTDQACEIIDAIIDDTLRFERENGIEYFLLSYARRSPWVVQPPRSVFVDSEVALMLAARRMLREHEPYKKELTKRIDVIIARMKKSPVLSAESYPDECWLFCNTVALAAIRIADALGDADHSAFLAEWIATAKERLIEPTTGILISAYSVDGTPAACGFGPEGSSIWLACHMLQIVDEEFATEQYCYARKELKRSILGFGYSREWPEGCVGTMDIDSGPVIAGLGASAAASGLGMLGAAAFDDDQFLAGLLASLNFAGFPEETDDMILYQASNPVGDAVMLNALVEGPLWERVRELAAGK